MLKCTFTVSFKLHFSFSLILVFVINSPFKKLEGLLRSNLFPLCNTGQGTLLDHFFKSVREVTGFFLPETVTGGDLEF